MVSSPGSPQNVSFPSVPLVYDAAKTTLQNVKKCNLYANEFGRFTHTRIHIFLVHG